MSGPVHVVFAEEDTLFRLMEIGLKRALTPESEKTPRYFFGADFSTAPKSLTTMAKRLALPDNIATTVCEDEAALDRTAKEIEAESEARKQASTIILAEQGHWYTAIIRLLFAFPLIIYLWKVIVWDKVLGFGSTDSLTGPGRRVGRDDRHRLRRGPLDREGRANLSALIAPNDPLLV